MRDALNAFDAGFSLLMSFLAVLVAISIALITILIPVNLMLLKLELGSMWWLYEAVEYALYVGVFIGAPWVLRQGAHVRVDVLLNGLPPRAAVMLERVVDAASAGLCVLLCYYGVRATLVELRDGTLPDKDLRIANWIMTSVFAFSFLMLTLEFLLRIGRASGIVDEARQRDRAGF